MYMYIIIHKRKIILSNKQWTYRDVQCETSDCGGGGGGGGGLHMLELLSCDVLLRQQLSSVSYIHIVHPYIHYTLHNDFCAYVNTCCTT